MIPKVKRALVMVLIILFVFMVLPYGRSTPRFEQQSKAQPHQGGNEAETYVAEESCEGLSEEECLMRRTLLAHTDYIYTQKQNP